jgi:hypothetical protein
MKAFKSYIQERKYSDREKEVKLSGGKSSVKINPDSESLKEADIKPPAEKLKTDRNMFSIPADERDAAKARLLAKAKARREAMQTEGKVAWDDKKNPNPSGYTPKEKSQAKRKQLGVDNPDTQSFEKGGPGEKEYARHGNLSAAQKKMEKKRDQPKGKKHEFKKNPFWKKDAGQVRREIMGTNVPKSKESSYPSSVAKAKSRNEETEMLSFSDFMEARRMDKEGVDRGDAGRSGRAEKAKASLAAVKKRQAVLDKHEKKTGTKLDISKSVEGKAHKQNHPGSRQAPKERGAKETPQETQNRRVNRQVSRVVKHGHTSKEKAANKGMYSSRFD